MDEETVRAFASSVEISLLAEAGQEWLNRIHAELYRAHSRHRFNTARATEMYAIAIERSVLAKMGDAMGSMTVLTLRRSGITAKMASELTDQFKEATGATDQRPARTGLLAMIIGK